MDGAFTNVRCLLLTHLHPIHRALEWNQNLEEVRSLSVTPVRGPDVGGITARGLYGAASIGDVRIDPTYRVLVDHMTVYVGTPDACADLQRRIDDARTARRMAAFGRVIPFDGPS